MVNGTGVWTRRIGQVSAAFIEGATGPFCMGLLAAGLPVSVVDRVDGSSVALIVSALPGFGGLAALCLARRGRIGTRKAYRDSRIQVLETEARDLREQLDALDQEAEDRRVQSMQGMAEAIELKVDETVQQLSNGVQRVKAISDSIAAVAERAGQNAVMSSEAADNSVSSASQLSETAEHLNVSIRSISAQVEQATSTVSDAMRASTDAKEVIGAMTGNIASIQSVADLIRAIAGQTNMLALNAMIEAARAGEAGRGFAVVANEVKELARKTTQSTQSIVDTIGAIELSSEDVVRAVDRMANSVVAIDHIAQGIAEAVAEQRQATADIAEHVGRTVEAAAALSDRILAMTGDVGSSFECAAEVHMAASEVAEVTDGLATAFRHSVSHAVRTSASEVDRRRGMRIPLDLPCRLVLEQLGVRDSRTTDLSEDGARVVLPKGNMVQIGMRGRLELPGDHRGSPIVFEVVNVQTSGDEVAMGLSFGTPIDVADVVHREAA